MSRPFWSFRTSSPATSSPALPPNCESIEPLLPLYADRMASPDEVRLVEAHLPGCEGCRESLFWMQATHRALASRPIAVPPANLQARIAEAIAASSAAPILLRPARSFTLRPAYAAAASLTVLGAVILGHSLVHPPVSPVPDVRMTEPAPPVVASVPSKANNVLPHTARVKPRQVMIARNVSAATTKSAAVKPVTAGHVLALKKTAPVSVIAPPDRVADNIPAHTFVPLHVSVKPAAHLPAALPDRMASAKAAPAGKQHPSVPDTATQKIASVPLLPRHELESPVAVDIKPPTVTEQPLPVRTASVTTPSGSLLATVNARARAMSTVPYAKISLMERQISSGGTDAIHELDHEHSGYQPAVYTP